MFAPDELIAALAHSGVEYVLIGGLAVGAHGFPRATKDVDPEHGRSRPGQVRGRDVARRWPAARLLASGPDRHEAMRRGVQRGTDPTPWPRPAWHTDGMSRTRLSTTVDADLLEGARRVRSGITDAVLIDEALTALLARHRAAEADASYAAYDEHPLDEPDEWGDLASFRRAAAAS
jgi:antitoxin MazE5